VLGATDSNAVVLGIVKERITGATSSLFSHGARPLEHTLDHPGDPGLLGPDSVSWRVIGDAAAFVGGVRALLVQTAHPEVVAGVDQHSRYRDDPLGRLNRTAFYVTETTYGSMPEVEAAVQAVRRAHRPVRGTSERDLPYRAADPAMAAWVHNVLTDSFLVAYQTYGPQPLTIDEADRFVEEQTRIGALLDAAPLPTTAAALAEWIVDHPALASSAAQRNSMQFLRRPPLSLGVQLGYQPLLQAAIATIPPRLRRIIGVTPSPGAECIGTAAVSGLRWALGSSPARELARTRALAVPAHAK
jgi:uncharacterized protein (DUF2236 family)